MSYQKLETPPELQERIDDFKKRIIITKDAETGLWRLQFIHVHPAKCIDRQAESHPKTGYCGPQMIGFRRDVIKLWSDYLGPSLTREAFEEVQTLANEKYVKRTKREVPANNPVDLNPLGLQFVE